jgi:imidazolonepropionase-like amidohydrolase
MKTESVDTVISGDLSLRAGWLIDGSGGPIKTDQLVTISSGRIDSVALFGQGHRPDGECVDLSHCTVLPALMDAHVHLTLSGTLDRAFRQAQLRQDADDDQAAVQRHLWDHWRNGVAAVRHAGDHRGVLLGFKPRTISSPVAVKVTGWAWHHPGRYGRMIGRACPRNLELDSAVAAASNGLDHIKVINSGINSLDRFGHQSQPQFSKDELQRVCRYARNRGLGVMVHANGQTAVQESIEAGCRSIEHGFFMGRDNLSRMAEYGVVWVPTAIPMAALTRAGVVSANQAQVARRTLDHQLAQIDQGRALGVTIALGTDAGSLGVEHGIAVRQELALLMQAGFSLTQAVRCGTRNAAQLMGFKHRGAILPGCMAELIAVKGAPDGMPGSLNEIVAVYQF